MCIKSQQRVQYSFSRRGNSKPFSISWYKVIYQKIQKVYEGDFLEAMVCEVHFEGTEAVVYSLLKPNFLQSWERENVKCN